MLLPERGCPVGEPPPFSRLDAVVTKAAREGCLMLIVAPELLGPAYPWWTALCSISPKRWCFPDGRPVYLRGGTEQMPAPRWRTWAFLLDSRPPQLPGHPAPPPAVASAVAPTGPLPPTAGGSPAQNPGGEPHGRLQAREHPALGQQAGEVRQEVRRATVRPHVRSQAPPFFTGPPLRAPSSPDRADQRQPPPPHTRTSALPTALRV